jgi:hypothetical protein
MGEALIRYTELVKDFKDEKETEDEKRGLETIAEE